MTPNELITELRKMGKQIICPSDNFFTQAATCLEILKKDFDDCNLRQRRLQRAINRICLVGRSNASDNDKVIEMRSIAVLYETFPEGTNDS